MIDWTQLARDVGSISDESPNYESGGDHHACAALERILGAEGIAAAVAAIETHELEWVREKGASLQRYVSQRDP
jgi:hypothetical protein